MARRFLKPAEVIEETGLPRDLVYRWLSCGVLRGARVGTRWYIPEQAVSDLMDRIARGEIKEIQRT